MFMSIDPVRPYLGIYPNKIIPSIEKMVSRNIFIVALCITAKASDS